MAHAASQIAFYRRSASVGADVESEVKSPDNRLE